MLQWDRPFLASKGLQEYPIVGAVEALIKRLDGLTGRTGPDSSSRVFKLDLVATLVRKLGERVALYNVALQTNRNVCSIAPDVRSGDITSAPCLGAGARARAGTKLQP
ncbi:MAG TPA: hypothetical protein DCR55_11790 [Lentisphaeria bacterium]|nr:hypothetical protein [Lentisphaeria bacterium]